MLPRSSARRGSLSLTLLPAQSYSDISHSQATVVRRIVSLRAAWVLKKEDEVGGQRDGSTDRSLC